jgi:hypothetical protein
VKVLRPDDAHEPGTALVMHYDWDGELWCWPEPAKDDDRTDFTSPRVVIKAGASNVHSVRRAVETLRAAQDLAFAAGVDRDDPTLDKACGSFTSVDPDHFDPWERCEACGLTRDVHEGAA